MSKKTRLSKLPDGTPFHCVNKMEMQFLYKEIFVDGVYENALTTINDGDVILDIGANIGLFLHYISRRCSRSTVYAFEPIPRIFAAMSQNAARLKGHDIHPICAGMSDRTGEATFTFLRHVTARSTMYPKFSPADDSASGQARELALMLEIFKGIPNRPLRSSIAVLPGFARRALARAAVKFQSRKRSITCPLMTVSQVIDEKKLARIDLLKVDVEGAEMDVVRGIREEHWPIIRQVILETHPGEDDMLGDIRKLLENHGFRTAVSNDLGHTEPTIFAAR